MLIQHLINTVDSTFNTFDSIFSTVECCVECWIFIAAQGDINYCVRVSAVIQISVSIYKCRDSVFVCTAPKVLSVTAGLYKRSVKWTLFVNCMLNADHIIHDRKCWSMIECFCENICTTFHVVL